MNIPLGGSRIFRDQKTSTYTYPSFWTPPVATSTEKIKSRKKKGSPSEARYITAVVSSVLDNIERVF